MLKTTSDIKHLVRALAIMLLGLLWAWPAFADVTVTVTASPPQPSPISVGQQITIGLQASAKGTDSNGDECVLTANSWSWSASVSYAASADQPYGTPPTGSYTGPTFDSPTSDSTNLNITFNISGYWKITPRATDAYVSSNCGSGSESGSTDIDITLLGTVTGPANVPGLSQYVYNLVLPNGVTASGISWSPGSGSGASTIINFSNNATVVSVTVAYTINGIYQKTSLNVAVVQITIGLSEFTGPGVIQGGNVVDDNYITLPGAAYVTTHIPGSDWAAFTSTGQSKGMEDGYSEASADANVGAFNASSTVTLTPPAQRPNAVASIEIGYIQKAYEYGTPSYPFGNGSSGTRTTKTPTTDTVDWLSDPDNPGPTDEWPWYDAGSMSGFVGMSGIQQNVPLNMRDSPSQTIPRYWNPLNPSDIHNHAQLGVCSEAFSFNVYMAVRTIDTTNNADQSYFALARNYWVARFPWPITPNQSIVSFGNVWSNFGSATLLNVNVVPTVTNHNFPFLTWVPSE